MNSESEFPALPTLTRRRFVAASATGAATFYLGGLGFDQLIGTAQASPGGAIAGPELRRSSYLALSSSKFTAAVRGAPQILELVGVDDLQSAVTSPELRGSEKAFSVRFRSSGGAPFEGETRTMSHPELGSFSLFISPIGPADPSEQEYEAVVDRTVMLPGMQDVPGPPASPGTTPPDSGEDKSASRPAPRLVDGALKRSRSRLRLSGHVTFSPSSDVVRAKVRLRRGGRTIARSNVDVRDDVARLRFQLHSPVPAGHYRLDVAAFDSSGVKTRTSRSLRIH